MKIRNVVKKYYSKAAVAGGVVALSATNALAAIDLSTFTIDVSPVEILAGVVLTAGATLWVIRKLIKTENRS